MAVVIEVAAGELVYIGMTDTGVMTRPRGPGLSPGQQRRRILHRLEPPAASRDGATAEAIRPEPKESPVARFLQARGGLPKIEPAELPVCRCGSSYSVPTAWIYTQISAWRANAKKSVRSVVALDAEQR